MKRILFVAKDMGLGGAEKQVVELSAALCGRGFATAIFVFSTMGEKGARVKDLDPRVEVISPLGNIERPSLSRGVFEVFKAVRRWRPDVLYSRLWNAKSMAALVGRFFGVRVILGVADSPAHEIRRKKHKGLSRLYRRSIYRLADAVVAVSEGLAREVEEVYGLRGVKAIRNGIDVGSVKAKSVAGVPDEYFPAGVPVMIAVGRMRVQKGFGHLIEAFSMVSETEDARLLIIGDGEMRERLRRMTESLGVGEKVFMPGAREAYAYVRRADIFVCSSLHEGMPNVVLEAMALGTPVVSTDCPYGPGEVIEHGESGLLVPVGDPVGMASAILSLIQDGELRSALAAEAERRLACFTSEEMVSAYEEVFLNV